VAIANYSRVRIKTDALRDQQAPLGSIGYVIEVFPTGDLEVEFADENGVTYAQVVVCPDEVDVVAERGDS
jgi:hypothetical protein